MFQQCYRNEKGVIMYPQLMEFSIFSRHWGRFLLLGVFLSVFGIAALANSCLATLVSVLTFGWVLISSGAFQLAAAFLARQWSGFFTCLLVGVLYTVAGLLIVTQPLASAEGLTMLLAALFVAGGLFRITVAILLWYPGWGWAVLDGALTLLMGVLIWAGWPSSATWIIGSFLGLSLLFHGLAWVMFAFSAREVEEENSPLEYYS